MCRAFKSASVTKFRVYAPVHGYVTRTQDSVNCILYQCTASTQSLVVIRYSLWREGVSPRPARAQLAFVGQDIFNPLIPITKRRAEICDPAGRLREPGTNIRDGDILPDDVAMSALSLPVRNTAPDCNEKRPDTSIDVPGL